MRGSDIINSTSSKITSFTANGHTVSAGFCGVAYLNNYMLLHLEDKFTEAVQGDGQMETILPEVLNALLDDYVELYKTPRQAPELTDYLSGIIVVDGTIYRMERFENERWHCMSLGEDVTFADGQADVAARCLLECKVKPRRIVEVISKYNNCVSGHLTAIENVEY